MKARILTRIKENVNRCMTCKTNLRTYLLEILMHSTLDTMSTKTKIYITLSTHVNIVL